MNDAKYIGMDVHTATISAAVQHKSPSIKWAAKQEKIPAVGEVFFLDFYLYRTNQVRLAPCPNHPNA
jgi:hypothetical protein